MQLDLQLPNYTQSTTTKLHTDTVGEIQLTYKRKVNSKKLQQIKSSRDAYEIFKRTWDINNIDFVEQFKVMLLNRANKVIGMVTISTGGTTACIVDAKLIYAAAIKTASCGLVIAHNHPSGNSKPSQADIQLTRKITQGCKLLDMELLDHLIITDNGYLSLQDEGLM